LKTTKNGQTVLNQIWPLIGLEMEKENPTALGGQSHGAKLFSRGYEEGWFRSACQQTFALSPD
jgi:hypothetical protein